MPLYEYQCSECRFKFSRLLGVVALTEPISCPKCGSDEVIKLVSRFRKGRPESAIFDDFADDFENIDDKADASKLEYMSKEMSKMVGDELGEDVEDDFSAALEESASEDDGT